MALNFQKSSRFLRVLRNLRQKRSAHYDSHGGGHHQTAYEVAVAEKQTMDFLPKPHGKWETLNAKRQQTYNLTLVVGTLLFFSAIFGAKGLYEDILWTAPYDKVSKDFPGAKFE